MVSSGRGDRSGKSDVLVYIDNHLYQLQEAGVPLWAAVWYSDMILLSGRRGQGFDSPNGPSVQF